MGISGLLPLLKKASKNCNVRRFSGCTVAIDAYCWLHKGAFGCAEKLGKGEPTTAYITYCMKYINVLLDNNIKPILVLDGRNLPSKEYTEKKRREKREENRKLARKYLQEGNRKGAWECFTRCVDITPAMAREFIKELRRLKIDYVVAPYEADAQLAYLAHKGIADIIITEDSDLVLFGCPRIFFKMNVNGDGVFFEQSKIAQSLGIKPNQFTFERFRWMCILSGCDYLPSIPGIGLGRAKKVIFTTTEQDINKIILAIPTVLDKVDEVPEGYIEGFIQAENTFLYQLVFDTISREVVPLTPYPVTVDPEELEYAGRYENKKVAVGLALGNIDLHSLDTVDTFDPLKFGYTNTSIWSRSFSNEDRAKVIEKLVSHSTTVGMQFSVSLGTALKKKRPLSVTDNDENMDDNDLMNMYAEETPPVTKSTVGRGSESGSDNEDLKESSLQSPSSVKRRRLSRQGIATNDQSSGTGSPSVNTRSKYRPPFLKSPESPKMKPKIVVLSKYFRSDEEEEMIASKKLQNKTIKTEVTETVSQKLSVSEKEKITSARVLLEKLPTTATVNMSSSQLSIYSLESSGSTYDESTSQSQFSSISHDSHISDGNSGLSESNSISHKCTSSTIPEIILDDEEDEAYASCSASAAKSSMSNTSAYFSRSSYSCSPGLKTSTSTSTRSASCRRQGLAKKNSKQRSVRDMLLMKQQSN
ncbi:unnamed protein product [Orchesella dallaii]|uniref:Exonuclease 1 n=1 Tax=Orchesella dallaii TaxID=48710 RepID=A0ABP1RD79_9HEXA